METNKKYFALTIGPIYKTMAMGRKTRELWASSYLFSFLMEQIITAVESEGKLVLPAKSTARNIKAGLYPDHLILTINPKESNYSKIDGLVRGIFNSLLEDLFGEAPSKPKDFFNDYFQLYSFEISLSDQEDPIKIIIPLLDSMEQKVTYVSEFEINYLEVFLTKIYNWKQYELIFGKGHRFPSVLEIATQSLKNAPDNNENINSSLLYENTFDSFIKHKKEDDEKYQINLLKQYFNNAANNEDNPSKPGEQFRFYHKYMAIVQADGDNLSQALHTLFTIGNTKAVQEFSKLLMDFGKDATKLIQDFGGTPIYMGGDDLLFFSPVKCKEKTIFHLVQEIDELFKTKLEEAEKVTQFIGEWNGSITENNRRKKVDLSISFGISIGYHKYPLKESLETARKLLFDEAKMVTGKNAISFRVLKHSGQYFGATWRKDWEAFHSYFFELLNTVEIDEKFLTSDQIARNLSEFKEDAVETDVKFLTSVQHKLEPLRPALYRILAGREIDPAKASFKNDVIKYLPDETGREFFLEHLLDNFFNETVHKEKYRKFLKVSFGYLIQVYRNMEDVYGNNLQTAQKAVDTLYATLRFIQFINQPDNNEEEN